jgi:2,3,4,5-tetrahydropyridine-2,6-dicarboxylate N-succinyltransferase
MPRAKKAQHEFQPAIEDAWERRATLTLPEIDGSTRPEVERVIDALETGELRVAEPAKSGGWTVNEWVKKAVLLYFRVNEMDLMESYPAPFWDKVPLRFESFDDIAFRE